VAVGKAKELARSDPLLTSTEVIIKTTAELPLATQHVLPKESLLKRLIQKNRASRYMFKDPKLLVDLKIPEIFRKTRRGQKFLMYDSEDFRKMLMFTTDWNIEVNCSIVSCIDFIGFYIDFLYDYLFMILRCCLSARFG